MRLDPIRNWKDDDCYYDCTDDCHDDSIDFDVDVDVAVIIDPRWLYSPMMMVPCFRHHQK